MTFNILNRSVSETGSLELLDADGEPLLNDKGERCSITLYGPGSRAFEEADAERANKIYELMRNRGGKAKISADEKRQMDARFHARVTASFNNWTFPVDKGAGGYEEYHAAYLERRIGFISAQIPGFLGDWGNFKSASPES